MIEGKCCTNSKCTSKGKILAFAYFGKKKGGRFGLREICKVCCVKYNKQYVQLNKSEVKRYQDRYNHSKQGKWRSTKAGALKRNLSFNITKDEFFKMILQDCSYCGKKSGEKLNGIDRINNSIGYELFNCVPCCERCNEIKMHYTLKETIQHIKCMLKVCENKDIF